MLHHIGERIGNLPYVKISRPEFDRLRLDMESKGCPFEVEIDTCDDLGIVTHWLMIGKESRS
jgi:hypothetical protein